MKIACIATSKIPSDTANSIQVMKTCQAISRLGHNVHLLVPGRGAAPWGQLAAHYGLSTRFDIHLLPASSRLKRYDFSLAAVRQARRLGADLLYLWALQAGVAGLLWGMPSVLEIHGPPEGKLGPALFRLFCRLPGRKRLLPITRALLTILEQTYPLSFAGQEVVIAPNGVDLERFQDLPDPAGARRLLELPEQPTASYTGHLYPGRGLNLLVGLAKRFPQVQFLWVGGRPEDVNRWQAKLAADRLANVRLVGFVENRRLPLYQAAADVLLMPYERVIEGSGGGNSADFCSPMKMFEYLAAGRAIIASDLPVLREVLSDQVALLCPPEQVEPWAEALSALLADPARRSALAAEARAHAGQYTWLSRARRCLEGFPPGQEND